ncbi:cation:proton antiporter domain-containing protein [Methanospirillum lacunae]|uniref:Potassium transporter KefB n=1 Tax=Methanospirillum lacunae TaxID=668570 RepID=A0A2V2N8W9_9EURY|nr:cation:proton antiporter [Methanospirillum lacunae]PWR72041.1 potassium transporter KefB [Methanospirillum lacunae]
MMEGIYTSFFTDIVVIFILSVFLLLVLYRIRIPSVVGFLLTGIIVGPSGLGLIHNQDSIEFFAEFGVIFLLFTIGLEFSISHILRSRQFVLIGGTVQVFSTILLATALMKLAGMGLNHAIFVGMLVSLSSTAIVMKVLADRQEVGSPHGKAALGILIFQDLIVIPMMMITPILGGDTTDSPSVLKLLSGGILIIAVVYISSRYVIPYLLHYAARLRNREMFLFIVIGTCLLIAYLTSEIGLSMALGAFLAGLIISESEYSMHAMYNMVPFRDIFAAFFFISIGMIFDLSYLLVHPVLVAVLVAIIIIVKYGTGTIAAIASGLPARSSVLTGISLSQIGEFSFILATTGVSAGILASDQYQLFLDVSVVTMGLAPLLISLSTRVSPKLAAPLTRIVPDHATTPDKETAREMKDHIIIVGFGLNGMNVAKSAKAAGVPYRIIEMNPDTVRKERKKGESILYGDAAQPGILMKAGIDQARVLVVVVNDPFATQQTVRIARELNPGLYIIARTRFMGEVSTLVDLGADDVIPEEFETSIEIFTRILNKYLIPEDEIERLVRDIRAGGYQMLRSVSTTPATFDDLMGLVPDIDMRTIRIPNSSPWVGKNLAESQLRNRFHVSVVAIRRGNRMIISPGGDDVISGSDILMIIGKSNDIRRAFHQCEAEQQV